MTAWDCFEASTDNNIAERVHAAVDAENTLDVPRVEWRIENNPFAPISVTASRLAIVQAVMEACGYTLAWERPL